MELKPCPFCQSREVVNDDGVGPFGESIVRYGAKCRGCGASFWHPDCGEINWNTRPGEDALREALENIIKIVQDERAGYGGTNVEAKLSALHSVEDIARLVLGRG